jgi:hypothetical protein
MAATAHELKLDPKYDVDLDYPTTAPEPQNGHPGHTTPEQDAQVFQLRSALEQAGYSKNMDTLTMVWRPASVGSGFSNPCTAAIPARAEIRCRTCEEDVSHYTRRDLGT